MNKSSDLERVVQLATLLQEQKAEVERLTDELKQAKQAADRTEREDLPDLMLEVGIQSFTLKDGSKVEIQEQVSAAITAANHKRAMAWLTENDFGGLIKTVVEVQFDRGDHEHAAELVEELQGNHLAATMKETVHHATLRAFVREQMAAGATLPLDLFSVHPYNISKITKGRK